MAHDTAHLTISQDEAARIDLESKRRLLSARKLSLVVDLDQTIIHAAVDPTIKEWMEDKDNPNHEAVSDVRAFQLPDDGPGMRGCWYYIKLRPGLAEFLEHVSQLYELHIYTMGTRHYAKQIAKLVDPNGKYFGDRILSRDESGSMELKSLERLFPIDTKMVVIIDDRGDVWQWSANLIRVTVFDFFVGIGDINSSFLPKKQEARAALKPEATKPVANGTESSANGEDKSNGVAEDGTSTIHNGTAALEQLIAMSGDDSPEVRELQAKGQEEIISSQLEDKPLLKMQLQQDQKDEAEAAAANGDASASQSTESDSSDSSESSELVSKPKPRHSILRDDDEELIHLEGSLSRVHEAFFAEYDRKRVGGKGGRVAELTGKRKAPLPEDDGQALDLKTVPDVKKILPPMKLKVLSGVTIVYSGVFPLGTDIHKTEQSIWAKTFGATVTDKISRDVTHLIASRPGTAKVKQAAKRGIKVVSLQWLYASIQQWRKLDERPYLLEGAQKIKQDTSSELGDSVERAASTANELLLSSSEGETTGLDTEDDQPARKKLKLNVAKDDAYQEVVDDGSPVTINQDEWADIDAELKEFLGSDAESESDTDSMSSALSIREGRRGKRRREEDGEDDSSASDADRSPARKRNGTGSALRTVNNIDSDGGSGSKPANVEAEAEAGASVDDSDDELARELERELEEYDDEEQARLAG
jgi:RNA polymerase II subunit A C-terminal domain phosphatase